MPRGLREGKPVRQDHHAGDLGAHGREPPTAASRVRLLHRHVVTDARAADRRADLVGRYTPP